MRIAVAQLNPIVGDLAGNTQQIRSAIDTARRDGADVLVTSELALIGYPPRDLLLRHGVVQACESAVQRLAQQAGDMTVIIGTPRRADDGSGRFYNSAMVCRNGEVSAVYDKWLLPGYDVFDEDRYFTPGKSPLVVEINNHKLGVVICEDFWRATDASTARRYDRDPVQGALDAGAEMLISLHASPFVVGKAEKHQRRMQKIAAEKRVPIVATHQVGANDDLIFEGRSLVVDSTGALLAALPAWQSRVQTVSINATSATTTSQAAASTLRADHHDLFHALALGLRDYTAKTNHNEVILGLSGGIDSALTAAVAAKACGGERVRAVLMPSRYSSEGSLTDSNALVENLGLIHQSTIPIHESHEAASRALHNALDGPPSDVTDENIQARLRAVLLMAMSNATGALLLATSNKSEAAVGYTTLYGDMCGAVAPIADLLKTRVYELAAWINDNFAECGFRTPPIPPATINKPPSAELRADQTDQDTLPPYEVLDEIIERYVDYEQSAEQIVEETAISASIVRQWTKAIDRSEYKRNQAPVILKVSPRAFGPGRPMPIVMKQTSLESSRRAEPRAPSEQKHSER